MVYHEKQIKSLCALHALNNLFQDGRAFKQEDLDDICRNLAPNSWVNPHKSVLGLGNYDINVIMAALQLKNCETIWFDKRKDPSELAFHQIYGFIMNIPSDCKFGWLALPLKRKHWVAVRNIHTPSEADSTRALYYNLDSKLETPECIGNEAKVIEYFREELKSHEKELFIVVTGEVGRTQTWKRTTSIPNEGSSSTSGTNTGNSLTADSIDKEERKGSTDSGVLEMLPDFKDINVVDLDNEELLCNKRRQSSGIWSDFM